MWKDAISLIAVIGILYANNCCLNISIKCGNNNVLPRMHSIKKSMSSVVISCDSNVRIRFNLGTLPSLEFYLQHFTFL